MIEALTKCRDSIRLHRRLHSSTKRLSKLAQIGGLCHVTGDVIIENQRHPWIVFNYLSILIVGRFSYFDYLVIFFHLEIGIDIDFSSEMRKKARKYEYDLSIKP